MKKTCINPKLYRLTLEKMVIGVEEPILIKGIGEIVAKVDSGNSGYNVIHGEDLVVQGDIINFKTVNKDGIERRVSKKIKDTININIGGGHIQQRPVVELDVQFGGEDYKKVQFSITNRNDNEHKILISKDFVGKELEALIDVTKDNISGDNIKVDYVTEGIGQTLKNVSNSVSNAVGTFTTGTNAQKVAADKWEARKKAMWGEEAAPETHNKIDQSLEEEVKGMENLEQQLKADSDLIKAQITKQKEKINAESQEKPNGLNVPVENNNIDVYKVIDYTGGTYSNQTKPDKEFQERLKKALAAYKSFSKEQPEDKKVKGESEETIVKEATESQTTPTDSEQNNVQSAAQQNNNSVNKDEQNNSNPSEQIQGKEGQKDISEMSEEEVKQVLEELKNRNRAIFYIIGFKKDNDDNQLLLGKDLFGALQTSVIDSWNTKICQGKDWSAKAFEPFAKQVAEKVKEGAKGLFALCSGMPNARNVEFFVNPGMYDGVSDEQNVSGKEVPSEIIEEYAQLNNEYKELGGEGEISEEGIQKLIEGQGANANNPGEIAQEFIDEFNQLNQEYLAIAEDMQAQPGDYIKPEDLQALIELGMESA